MFQGKRSSGTVEGGETGAGSGNRTGMALAPEMALDLIRAAQKAQPSSEGDARVLAEYRAPYIKAQETMGSRPEPMDAATAGSLGPLLLDKLGERLLFERQGVRLYEALVGKAKLLGKSAGGPSLDDLEHILSEEREHFRFLQAAVVESGGDPTALTPCANIAAVLSQGVVPVVTDPRSTMVQCLEAMLLAELADNDGWTLLRQVARAAGAEGLVERIEEADAHEGEHLERVRGWLSAMVAGGAVEAGSARRAPAGSPQAGVRTAKASPGAGRPKTKDKIKGKAKAKPAAKAGTRRADRPR